MTEQIRGLRAAARHWDRSKTTIEEWVRKGCPHDKDGGVYLFDADDVSAWMDSRTGFNDDTEESAEYKLQRARKTKLEADKLQFEKEVRQGMYCTVDEFETTTERMLVQIKSLMHETFSRMKDQAGLTAAQEQALEDTLITGFNRIAGIEFD